MQLACRCRRFRPGHVKQQAHLAITEKHHDAHVFQLVPATILQGMSRVRKRQGVVRILHPSGGVRYTVEAVLVVVLIVTGRLLCKTRAREVHNS